MADRLTREKRSWNMSHIRSKDTGIEVKVRKFLFSKGYRYRKNDSKLPGKPDIVLPKYKTVIFVHGCYWHRHPGCKNCTTPSTNTDFRVQKTPSGGGVRLTAKEIEKISIRPTKDNKTTEESGPDLFDEVSDD